MLFYRALPLTSAVMLQLMTLTMQCYAGETSVRLGSVSALLEAGYRFVGGGPLDPEVSEKVAMTETPPIFYGDLKHRGGTLYLTKDSAVAVCIYDIVLSNASPKYNGPGSVCYKVQ